jgi:drug/metabolite transporter, DME family
MPGARASILLVVAAGVLFGTAGTAQALGPEEATPVGVGVLRIQVGALALLAAMPLLRQSPRGLIRLWRSPAMLVTAITAAVYQLLFFAGVSQTGVALGTLLAVGSEPVFAGIVAWAVLGHRPSSGWLLATLVCIVGLVLRSSGSVEGPVGNGSAIGLLLALGAGLCSAGYTVAAKVQLDRGVTALEVPAGSFALGGLLLLPVLATQPMGWIGQPSGLALALYLGVATMALANVLLARGIHGLRPGPVATLMLVDPVVATVLGVVVLGESLLPVAALGVLLVLGGIVLQGLLVTRSGPGAREPVPVL